MKKIILSLIALAMTASMMAQQPREFNPENMAKRQVAGIQTACNLNEEQTKAVEALLLDNAKKMKAQADSIMAAGGDFRQSFDREAMRKRNEEQNAAIKAILTEEQYEAYTKYQAERRQRGPRRQ